MTNFAVGVIFGFLVCVWAIQTSPSVAVAALWQRLQQVQQTSAAASHAYDAMHLGHHRDDNSRFEKTDYR